MPPKKAISTAVAKKATPLTTAKSNKSKTEVSVEITTKTKASTKRKTAEAEGHDDVASSSEDERPTKKTKNIGVMSGGKKTAEKKGKDVATANTKAKRSAGAGVATSKTGVKKQSGGKRKVEDCDEGEEVVQPVKRMKTVKKEVSKAAATKATIAKKIAAKKTVSSPAKKKASTPKPQKKQIEINSPPTKSLHIFVFGEGSQGELGLGAKNDGKRTVIDVTRPRLNPFLEKLDVVQVAVGGMHCAALTVDNKIYTWGVNDQGALGRPTTDEGKKRDVDHDDLSDSESDSEDEDSGLNPSEAEPRQIDSAHFPEGTKFAEVFAGDSTTFALTTTGLVYGWGTFRGNDGVLGFNKNSNSKDGAKTQGIPTLIPELKQVRKMAIGTNHALALTHKNKAFVWGAGEQSQLGRRVVARTAAGALVPREFGFQRKKIIDIATGDYFSYAVEENGTIYAWGHNGYGQTGISVEKNQDDIIAVPTKVEGLKGKKIKQLAGGNHHTIARTEDGEVLVWGRLDNAEGGIKLDTLTEEAVIRDEVSGRILASKEPITVPELHAGHVATGTDTCFVITTEGKAYSWGFSTNYQTGQGTDKDVVEATLVENSAVKGKVLCFAGVGGQFGILACEKNST